MSGVSKRYRFLVSPYLFSMTAVLFSGVIAAFVWTAFFVYGMIPEKASMQELGLILGCLAFPLLVLLVTGVCEARLWWGWYEITDASVTLHAPFRRPLTLRYEDVRHVGVGRNQLSVNYACWLYLSCDPVPLAQLEDMRKFRLTRRSLRIAYSPKTFDALGDCLPPDLARQLQRSKTSLRAWGVKD